MVAAQDPAQDARIKELTEENGLLSEQLRVVQEELEKYYYKFKAYEDDGAAGRQGVAYDPGAAAVHAENLRLKALAEQQCAALRVETRNSLNARLGDMLVAGSHSLGSMLGLPGRLRALRKAMNKRVPPAALGGKDFPKVIDAYGEGGDEAVETLLDAASVVFTVRADAYTALARHLLTSDAKKAAAFARLAWETDPRPYRLKWLTFRVHDADDVVTAEALLDMLPSDVSMSESEQKRAKQIRHESERTRMEEARKRFERQRQEYEQAMAQKAEQAELRKVADERKAEVARLTARVDELRKAADQAQAALQKQADGHKAESAKLTARVDELQKAADQARAALQKQVDGHKAEVAALTERLAKQAEERKAEASKLTARVDELQKVADQCRRDADQARARQTALQKQADGCKASSDALSVQTAHMLRNMLTEFEPDKDALCRMMRVIMGERRS